MARGDPDVPSPDELEAAGARIGSIGIERVDVFDRSQKGENHFLGRLTNVLHIETRDGVVRRELLFHEGDLFRQALLDETARNIRQLRFLYNVRIRPVAYHDGLVDILVHVQDNWTTRLSVRAQHLGGTTETKVELRELNLLGLGKDVQIFRESNIDRTSYAIGYKDPRLLGTRFQLRLLDAFNSDGHERRLEIERPFFALDSRFSVDAAGDDAREQIAAYDGGDVRLRFTHDRKRLEGTYGFSPGLAGDRVWRLRAGFLYQEDAYADPVLPAGFTDARLPVDRKLCGPKIVWERQVVRYILVRNFEKLDRDEDYNLGPTTMVSAVLSREAFGASDDSLYVQASHTAGAGIGKASTLLYGGTFDGQLFGSEPANAVATVSADLFDQRFEYHTIHAGLRLSAGLDLEPGRELLLGGDSGLRAFDARRFDGDRLAVATLEDRLFRGWTLFHLLDVGFAAFADVGDCWRASGGPDGLHTDVGLGIRLGVRKSAHAGLVNLDVSYPLDRVDGERAIMFSVGKTDF